MSMKSRGRARRRLIADKRRGFFATKAKYWLVEAMVNLDKTAIGAVERIMPRLTLTGYRPKIEKQVKIKRKLENKRANYRSVGVRLLYR